MQLAWAAVFLFAGMLGCVEEYRAIQRGRALTPLGREWARADSPWGFWFLTSLGIVASSCAVALGLLMAMA